MTVDCGSGIDWGEARVVACEHGLRQRKAREGIESLRERSNGNVVLNNYEPLTTWRPTLDRYLDSESKNAYKRLKTLIKTRVYTATQDITFMRCLCRTYSK